MVYREAKALLEKCADEFRCDISANNAQIIVDWFDQLRERPADSQSGWPAKLEELVRDGLILVDTIGEVTLNVTTDRLEDAISTNHAVRSEVVQVFDLMLCTLLLHV
ncbi:hypothetical protein HDU90_008671 [Geranomyces variabilis]|nr:hypothetical protein HDU90_008671 [Geranomyces variabilis]